MSLSSMTGFSRATGENAGWSWSWEIKSVNGKGLDVRVRVPSGFEATEIPAKTKISSVFSRGNIQANLQLTKSSSPSAVRINHAALDAIVAAAQELSDAYPNATPPSIDGLLNARGVLEASETELDQDVQVQMEEDILASLSDAIAGLSDMRAAEGASLLQALTNQIDQLKRLRAAAGETAEAQEEMIRAKLTRQVMQLIEDNDQLDGGRLEQEAALLMTKADVREELDRLDAHLNAIDKLMNEGGTIGRRLDFLCQELNREANTICSKAQNIELTQVGLDFKATIEQFREQIQNIE